MVLVNFENLSYHRAELRGNKLLRATFQISSLANGAIIQSSTPN